MKKIDFAKNIRFDESDARADAAGKVWFNQELSKEISKEFMVKYPGLMARELIDVNTTSAQSGDTEIYYDLWDGVTSASAMDDSCESSPAKVSVGANRTYRKIQGYENCLCYNIRDLRRSQRTGKGLPGKLAATALRGHELKLEDVACFGDASYGILSGFLNDPNVAVDASAGAWDTLTPDQIVDQVKTLQGNMDTDTQGVHNSSTDLLVPYATLTCLKFTRMTDGAESVLSYLQEKTGLRVTAWNKLNTAGAGGVTRAVLYTKDPMHQELHIVNAPEFFPAERKGKSIEVETMMETAGTTIYYPRSIRYMDGV